MGSCWPAWPRLAHQRKREQTTGEREGLTEWNASETQRENKRHGRGEGRRKKKRGSRQKKDERNVYSRLITHKSIGWCVESH